jgi:murein DD-endopeptidase MepM/ murein hydrolase activator NlpD
MKLFFSKDRKYRMRVSRSFLLFFFFIATCCFIYGTVLDKNSKKIYSFSSQPLQAQIYSPVNRCAEIISYVVKPGDTFWKILSGYDVSEEIAINCSRTLKSLGLSSIIPGDSIILIRNTNGVTSGFSLLHRFSSWYNVQIDSSGIRTNKTDAKISSCCCMVKGVLSTSLSENMNELGVDDVCVSKFADIFAWDINFFVDPQPGDSFALVFEKKYAEGRIMICGDILYAKYVSSGKVFEAIGLKNEHEDMTYYDCQGRSLQKQFLKAPLHFTRISSGFSFHRKHPVLGIIRPHLGIDYAAPAGTPVYAAADGLVIYAGYNGGYGKYVRIRHGNAYETSYGHLKSISGSVRKGLRVTQGDLIGLVGQTGLATGPHLDYRMTVNSHFVNPSRISLPAGKIIPDSSMNSFMFSRQGYKTLFETRFTKRTGCFVLNIDNSNNEPVRTSR